MKAIILCAGEGTRLRPVTLQKPKPLLIVGGKTLLENTLQYLHSANIFDITLVVGYMADKFLPYKDKYSLNLVHSTEFQQTNNHSSLRLVKDRLEDTVIIDGDLYLHQNVFQLIKTGKSQFMVQLTEKIPEWQCITDTTNRIVAVKKNTLSGYSMSGVSYWAGHAATMLAAELQNCSATDYWEDAAIRVLEKTPVYATECTKFQTEIDVLYHAYTHKLLSPDEIAMQCSDKGYSVRLKGLTNHTYLVSINNEQQVLRIPGKNTETLIDRGFEHFVLDQIKPIQITPQSQFFEGGIKLMPYLKDHVVLPKNEVSSYLPQLCTVLRKLHALKIPEQSGITQFSVVNEIYKYEVIAKMSILTQEEKETVFRFADSLDKDPKVLCHRDLLLENILVHQKDLQLIDFEYANYTSKYWDIASFITESRMELEDQKTFAEVYGDLDFQRVMQATIVVEYIWSLWGFAMGYINYGRKRIIELDKALTLYDTLF